MSVAVGLTPDWKQWEGELVDGEFALEQFLGSGKRSAVFRTRPASSNGTSPNRAIKLVQVRADDAKQLVERWTRAGALDHPHLLKIFKTGIWSKGGTTLAYLVTEYADENLGTVLEERALTAEETFEALRPIAGTLAFLHSRGLALGNLRPANIFAVDETLKLAGDAIAPGDPAADMRAFAAALMQALTQKAELNGVDGVPSPFREIVRNCVGASGQPAWSSVDLVSWLRSPSSLGKPAASAGGRAKAKPRITRYAIATGTIFATVIVVGSIVKSRDSAPAAAAKSTPPVATPVQAPPAVSPVKSAPKKQAAAKQESPKPEAIKQPTPKQEPPREIRPAPDDGTSSAQAVEQPLPEISAKARGTIHGTVVINVRVTVDETGSVTEAALQPTGSHYLGKLCTQAARKWRFTPAAGGSHERMLRFVITQQDTHASILR